MARGLVLLDIGGSFPATDRSGQVAGSVPGTVAPQRFNNRRGDRPCTNGCSTRQWGREWSDGASSGRGERVLIFPIRHHSPAAARHVDRVIRERRPRAVLIEGPATPTA
jgi:hypothetical protein